MRAVRASMSSLSARFVCAVSLADDFRPFGVVRSRVFRSFSLLSVAIWMVLMLRSLT